MFASDSISLMCVVMVGLKIQKKLKDFHKAQRLTNQKITEIPPRYHPIPKVKILSTVLIFHTKFYSIQFEILSMKSIKN
jgi:hypothetical protein